ncbi:hypothetical protein [Roseibium sediminicola]|uniref:Uncharacterized protein n=1 Tax=Roseibium sediminicola TaxID=2933272 RepID=A0ABT0H350_9HYPH|nr:hypothetical protein [Roseibium sp. CAU 1639]MCK7615520.1 hypothetical protein [Roseibium sp. CAU 1639]
MSTTATTAQTLDPPPESWVAPGASDSFATAGLITLLLLLLLVIYLYAVFDRYAEHKGSRTPIRTTIPTMLVIGLAYDLVPPLRDVSLLLPATLIFAAFAYDVVLWMKPEPVEEAAAVDSTAPTRETTEAPEQRLAKQPLAKQPEAEPPVADVQTPVEQKGASA